MFNRFLCPYSLDYDESGAQKSASKLQPSESNHVPSGSPNAAPNSTSVAVNHSAAKDKRKDKQEEMQQRKDEALRTQEEKRRHIKSIIDKIPVAKADLFNFKLDWAEIDNALMERKIRPWINKKIIEYIGEPEPTLVDFICSKVMAGSTPQGILDDVQMVCVFFRFIRMNFIIFIYIYISLNSRAVRCWTRRPKCLW